MPDTAWPISGLPPDSSRNLFHAPVLMPPRGFDTSATIRLRSPSRSPPDASYGAFSRSLTATVFSQRMMRWFEAFLRRTASKGQCPSSFTQHRIKKPPYTDSSLRSGHTEDPPRGGLRPGVTAHRANLVPVPPCASPDDHRVRPVPSRHNHAAPVVRVLRHPARHPAGYTSWVSLRTRREPGRPSRPQPVHGPRRRPPTLPVPDPRPRQQVHRRLRRRVRRHQHPDRQDTATRAMGERDCRTLRRHCPTRTARPSFDHQPSARWNRAARVRMPLQRSPSAPRPGAGGSPTAIPHRTATGICKIHRRDRVGGLLHEYQHVA